MPKLNPFRYGKPVPPEWFVGRQDVLQVVFSRLHNGESTAVVGSPHIGKSSLLRYLVDIAVQSEWLPSDVQNIFIELDCHLLPQEHHPAEFWLSVLSSMEDSLSDPIIRTQVTAARSSAADALSLERLFRLLSRKDARVILLIDEFDALLHHPNFNRAEFFGALRSLSSRTDGLALVTASRLPVAAMNRRSQALNPLGSPFFNTTAEVQLQPLRPTEMDRLLDHALQGTGIQFSQANREFLACRSGLHPYLLQVAAAALFDAMAHDAESDDLHAHADRVLEQRAAAFCDDLWRHLEPPAQAALLALSQAQQGRRPDALAAHAHELQRLSVGGLVTHVPGAPPQSWRISADLFAWWLARNVPTPASDIAADAPWATRPLKLFYSYSDKDEALHQELEVHLTLLQRQGIVAGWHKRCVAVGEIWQDRVSEHLDAADLIVLLVSADFLASNYCYEVEMNRALERHRSQSATVIPIVVRDVDLQGAPFREIQGLPGDGKPVTLWRDRDAAWRSVAEGIRQAATDIIRRRG